MGRNKSNNPSKGAQATQRWRDKNNTKVKKYMKDYEARSETKIKKRAYAKSLQGRFQQLKSHAKRRSLDVVLTFEEYCEIIKYECIYCEGSFRKFNDYSGYFIDRLDNSIGYIIDNCYPCCDICNRIKSNNFTYEQTKAAVEAILMFGEF
jgi:hypothetical protein